MRADIMHTGADFVERKIGSAPVRIGTDIKALLSAWALQYWKTPKFNVRRDENVFGWVAVNKDGDTLHLI
jgi:hypothetical protein